MNFVTIGDKNFFRTIIFSVRQVKKLYPESKFYIYDWGFTDKQIDKINNHNNTTIIRWEKKFIDLNIQFNNFFQKLGVVYGINNIKGLIRYIIKTKSRDNYLNFIKREMKFANKLFCLLDICKKSKENFIFLDGDAFLINRIDELFNMDFDIGVTLRRKREINLEKGNCMGLNAGVIIFKGGAKNRTFLDFWKSQMLRTNECFVEQTSLTRIIEKIDKNIFDNYYNEGALTLSDQKIKIKIFPCEVYNYNWIEEGFNKEKNKILHFKGGRHSKEKFNNLIKELEL